VGSDEYILSDSYLSIAFWFSGAPVEVSKNRGPQTDGGVLTDRQSLGVQFIDIYELANPDIPADPCSTQAMEPRPDRSAARHDERQFVKQSSERTGEQPGAELACHRSGKNSVLLFNGAERPCIAEYRDNLSLCGVHARGVPCELMTTPSHSHRGRELYHCATRYSIG
jgi:hypothetical protein